MSAKAYEALSKSNELTATNETAQSPKQNNDVDEKERKKRKKAALIKFGSLAVFAFIVWIFATISWFSSNDTTTAGGMGVSAGANGFELRVSGSNIGYSDLYSFSAVDPSYSTNDDLETGPGIGQDTIRFRISGADDKIKPGTCGKLEFEIIPYSNLGPSTLVYKIDIETFTAVITKVTQNETTYERVDSLSKVTSSSGVAFSATNRLRTHLMFFKSATPDIDPTKDPTGYHGFISDTSHFTLTPTDEDHDGIYSAVIYWIWPNTFGQIALPIADQKTGVNAVLDITGETSDRSAITTYMTNSNNVAVFFKGSEEYDELLSAMYDNKRREQSYDNEYRKLSAGYNAADREIGNNLDFVLLTLTADIN